MDYKENLAVALYRIYKYKEAVLLYDEIKKIKPEKLAQLSFIDSMGKITPKYKKFD